MTLQYTTLHCITLHYITSHYVILHYTTLHTVHAYNMHVYMFYVSQMEAPRAVRSWQLIPMILQQHLFYGSPPHCAFQGIFSSPQLLIDPKTKNIMLVCFYPNFFTNSPFPTRPFPGRSLGNPYHWGQLDDPLCHHWHHLEGPGVTPNSLADFGGFTVSEDSENTGFIDFCNVYWLGLIWQLHIIMFTYVYCTILNTISTG